MAAAKPQDVGKGVARLPRKVFEALGLAEGGAVAITGKRSTAEMEKEYQELAKTLKQESPGEPQRIGFAAPFPGGERSTG